MLERLLLALIACVAIPTSASIVGETGAPEFINGFSPTRLLTRQEYNETHRWGVLGKNPIQVTRFPEDATDSARFGMLQFETRKLTYMVEPRVNGTLRIVFDRNADGDLTNDPPVESTKGLDPSGKDVWTVVIAETKDANATRIKLVLRADASMAYVHERHTREGSIRIGDRSVRFILQGMRGVYDQPHNQIYIDMDGDGEIEQGDLGSEGAYEVADRFLYMDGRRYRFEVTNDGSSLTLIDAPTDEPPPPPVHAGATAARFAFVDMEGRPGTFDDYRGSVVLLYFWGSWCGPCIHTLPDLAQTYREYRGQGLQVLAIAKKSAVDDVRSIMAEHDLDWRQILEDESNPIASLYRITGVPGYVLIDVGGTIVKRGRGFDLRMTLGELIPGESYAD